MKKKIQYLREQPEHVKYRAASYLTVGSGIIIVILWVTIFLPLQLRLQNSDKGERVVVEQTPAATSAFVQASPSSQVGGAFSESETLPVHLPSQLVLTPTLAPSPSAEISATPNSFPAN